jgi:rSAM/selenodomain-associated transferase 1
MGGRTPTPARPSGGNASRCLLVFTKPPVPGRVKTRLIGHLSAGSAALLHQALLGDLLDALAGGRFSVRVAVALEPRETLPAVRHPVVKEVERQHGADLGERMCNALSNAGRTHDLVAVVGSDLPGLDARRVDEAFDRLERGADVVLGPTADGGYYLLALHAGRVEPGLFAGVSWSTGRVLEQTLERCARLGLRRAMLDPGRDIDRPADLEWLIEALRSKRVESPRVAAWLRRHDVALGSGATRRRGGERDAALPLGLAGR